VIGLATNVIVRYLAQDDVRQAAMATRPIEGSLSAEVRGFVSIITLAEVVWVMTSDYRAARTAMAALNWGPDDLVDDAYVTRFRQRVRDMARPSPYAPCDPAGLLFSSSIVSRTRCKLHSMALTS